jgi:hypothetical protein
MVQVRVFSGLDSLSFCSLSHVCFYFYFTRCMYTDETNVNLSFVMHPLGPIPYS